MISNEQAALALFPVLKLAEADAEQGGELVLVEAEFFPDGFSIRSLEGGAAGRLLFAVEEWLRLP